MEVDTGRSLAAAGVSIVALICALVALVAASSGEVEPSDLEELDKRLETFEARLAGDRAAAVAATDEITKLNAKLDKVQADLERARSTPPPAIDAQVIERAVDEALRARADRMGGPKAAQRRDPTAESLQESLGVDRKTAERLTKLRSRISEGMREIFRNNRGGGREDNMRLMKELREKADAALKDLLTPEQYKKYRQMDRGRGRGRGRRPPGRRQGEQPGGLLPAENQPMF